MPSWPLHRSRSVSIQNQSKSSHQRPLVFPVLYSCNRPLLVLEQVPTPFFPWRNTRREYRLYNQAFRRLTLILDLVVPRDSLCIRWWGRPLARARLSLVRRSCYIRPVAHVPLPWWRLLGFGLAAAAGARCATLIIVADNDICHATTALGLVNALIVVVAGLGELCNNVPCVKKTWDLFAISILVGRLEACIEGV